MPPQNLPGGGFGQGLGDISALKAAMSRRGVDTAVLDQISPAAPGPTSPVASTLPEGTPNISGTERAVAEATTPALTKQPGIPFRSAEMELSLKALRSVVDTESKIAELSLGLR